MGVKVSYAESSNIEISREEYNDLVRDSERVAAMERFLTAHEYISREDIIAILGIERKEN